MDVNSDYGSQNRRPVPVKHNACLMWLIIWRRSSGSTGVPSSQVVMFTRFPANPPLASNSPAIVIFFPRLRYATCDRCSVDNREYLVAVDRSPAQPASFEFGHHRDCRLIVHEGEKALATNGVLEVTGRHPCTLPVYANDHAADLVE
jgi:hypothetical protein